MADKTISLSRSYTVNDTTFDKVTLREPTYSDVFMSGLGEPVEWQPSKTGVVRLVYTEVVDRYLQRLIQAPGYECIHDLSVTDGLRLQEAVFDFFSERAAV